MAGVRLLCSTILSRPVLAPLRRQLSVTTRSLSKESDVDHEVFRYGEDNTPSSYRYFFLNKKKRLQARLQDPERFQHVTQRKESTIFSRETLKEYFPGKYLCVYRGMDMMKAPTELMVYTQMFWHVRPRTVFELGAYTGASAIWMADVLKLSEVDCNIYSVDCDLSLLEPRAKELQPSNLTFIEGNCERLETILPADFLAIQPHPWVVIEDVHDGMEASLEHFHHHLTPGDYVICEDTSPDLPSEIGAGSIYEGYGDWGPAKLHAWKRFLAKHGDKYAIDTFFTDLFGYNSTTSWDGFARRMK